MLDEADRKARRRGIVARCEAVMTRRPIRRSRGTVADGAASLQALITAHLDEGHLLPRDARASCARHASRFRRRRRRRAIVGVRRAGAAESRTLPRCGRWSSIGRTARDGLGSRAGRGELRASRAAPRVSSRCARSRTTRRLLPAARDSRSFRTCWLPEKIAIDCVRRARCSAGAASTRCS